MAYQADGITCYANTSKDTDFIKKYGCLYVWNNAKNICPKGWRLPSKDDFNNLLKRTSSNNFLALIAKSTAWTKYSNQGGDDFGFGGLPAGLYISGSYYTFGYYGYWWSSTANFSSGGYRLLLGRGTASVYSSHDYKARGFSVRCVKDED